MNHASFCSFAPAALLALGLSLMPAGAQISPPLPVIPTNEFYVTDYGAIGDDVSTNTTAIQAAINAASANGGIVVIPNVPGANVYLCGPLTLKNKIKLRIETNAVLKMLAYGIYPGTADFITASSLNNIALTGFGTIEGQGQAWWTAYEASGIARPKAMFAPSNCRTVLVENVTLQAPPNTHISLRSLCREVTIRGITINTTSDVLSDNTDGIDVNATNCLIQNCTISCGDDHIALGGGSRSVYVTNCIFGNGHGISIGSHTDSGGVDGFLVDRRSLTIADSASLSSGIRMKSGRDRGGYCHNLTYLNLGITNNQNPIFISSYYPDNTIPSDPTTDTGSAITGTTPIWRDIVISNVNIVAASGTRNAGRVYGLPEMPITNLTLMTVTITATASFDMYHVKNARFSDVQMSLPGSVNTYRLYDTDLTVSNSVYNNSLLKIGGWSSATATNQLAFYNARASLSDTNLLRGSAPLTLGASTLTISNSLSLGASSVVNFSLGSSNTVVAVTGALTLGGTINVSAGPGFTNGTYTIFTYGTALAWASPALGNVPPDHLCSLNTNTAGQVKLIVAPPPPDAPASLSATATNLAVVLGWPAVALATGYNVKRSTTNGGPHLALATNLAATDYLDTEVTNGVEYFYVVSASNANGEGANSTQASAIPLPSAMPANLLASLAGNVLHFSWPADHKGWRLQAQTNSVQTGLGTNWTDVSQSGLTNVASIPVNPANESVFFRLIYP
jgi:polygalacturonase